MADASLDQLEQAVLAAHENGDLTQLAAVYGQAASHWRALGEEEQEAFFLTHAWIFALEAGAPLSEQYWQRLRSLDRV